MISVGNVVGRFYYDFAIVSPTLAAVVTGCVAAAILLCALGVWLGVTCRRRSARGRTRKESRGMMEDECGRMNGGMRSEEGWVRNEEGGRRKEDGGRRMSEGGMRRDG